MDSLQSEFQLQIEIYLKSIQKEVENLFKQAIQESIYDAYNPTKQYVRTYTFLNSVRANIDLTTGKLFVHTDLNEGSNYYSAVDGSSQFSNIETYLESGHKDSTGISGMYHSYAPTLYLERAYELINRKFPELTVKIIKEE